MRDDNPLVGGETFRLRLTQEEKVWLFAEAKRRRSTVSGLMRGLVEAEMKKTRD